MSDFNRAYRDPKSPLQPLTPLSVNPNYSFNIGGDGSLKPWLDQFDLKRGKRKLKSFFSPQPQPHSQRQLCGTPDILADGSPKSWLDKIDVKRGKRNLKSFLSPQPQLQQQKRPYLTPTVLVDGSPVGSGCQCGWRKLSPLPIKKSGLFSFKKPQIIVPREKHSPKQESKLLEVLKKVGMLKYWNFFQLNGIDFGRFQKLTCIDFEEMGINKPKHLDLLLKGVELARRM